jgi:hypothetical protein
MKTLKNINIAHALLAGLFFLLTLLFLIFPDIFSTRHQVISMRFVAIFTTAALAYYGYLLYGEMKDTSTS